MECVCGNFIWIVMTLGTIVWVEVGNVEGYDEILQQCGDVGTSYAELWAKKYGVGDLGFSVLQTSS
jgi:hypothetical protein